ncbi:GPALPP motifs-containing protein 1 isoform X2 [Podarcis muralis]
MASRGAAGPSLPAEPDRAEPCEDFGPVVGPALPPDYYSSSEIHGCDKKCTSPNAPGGTVWDSEDDKDSSPTPRKHRRYQEDDDDGFFGPALPPGFKKPDESPERPVIGPALPPGFKKPSEAAEENIYYATQTTDSSEEEEDLIGPMPAKGPVESSTTREIECRAQRMKDKLLGKDDGPKQAKRESWMTDLPPELKSFGLGPRTFKRRADDKSGDRSIWTDTPADREKKAQTHPVLPLRKAELDESLAGIKIAGRNINNLRYADDTTLMAESEEELRNLLLRVKEESTKCGLKLNIKKRRS